MDEDVEDHLILSRPFLTTSQALIDVRDGKLVFRMGNEEVTFKLPNAMKHSLDFDDSCYYVNVIDDFVDDYVQELMRVDPLVEILNEECVEEHDIQMVKENLVMEVALLDKESQGEKVILVA